MAEYDQSNIKVEEGSAVEATDRGIFNVGKKEEVKKCDQGQAISAEFDEKVRVSEPDKEEGKKHGGLLEKLHRSGSSSSSVSFRSPFHFYHPIRFLFFFQRCLVCGGFIFQRLANSNTEAF